MGGSALSRKAHRLTTPQLEAFIAYCVPRLQPHFTEVRWPTPPKDKDSHGDIDLLCGFTRAQVGQSMKGKETGELDGHGNVIKPNTLPDKSNLADFAVDIVKTLGGCEWVRSGNILSVGVPCNTIDAALGKAADEDHEPFFQVDLLLLAPESVDFCDFSFCCCINIVHLSTAMRVLSKSLYLGQTHLSIKHSPYFGLPAIELVLTCDVAELCDFLGLDYTAFKATTFESEKDLWLWLANCKEGGALYASFERLVKGVERPKAGGPHHARKMANWDLFLHWLRFDKESVWSSRRVALLEAAKARKAAEELEAKSQPKPIADEVSNPNVLDANFPTPLDTWGKKALEHWNLKKQYKALFDQRTEAAIELAKRQLKKGSSSSASTTTAVDDQAGIEKGLEELKVEA